MGKKVDLEIAYELLGETPAEPAADKKTVNLEKKKMKELRANHPIHISVSFKYPWWAVDSSMQDVMEVDGVPN